MKKLLILGITLLIPFISISQDATVLNPLGNFNVLVDTSNTDSLLCLPKIVLIRVAQDLERGDAAFEKLEIQDSNIRLLQEQIVFQNNQIEYYQDIEASLNRTIKYYEQIQLFNSESLKQLNQVYQTQKLKTTIFQSTTGAFLGLSAYLLVNSLISK